MANKSVDICILGSGVIGLTCAVQLLEAGYQSVTVVGEKWTPHTTSDGAGAFWERHSEFHKKWARTTLAYYDGIIASGKGEEVGVGYIEGSQFHHDNDPYPFQTDLPEGQFKLAAKEEIAEVAERMGEELVCGCHWRTVIVDSPTHLVYLVNKVRELGGRLIQKRVESLQDLAGHFEVILNCTGLGAREIVGDSGMRAARGQTIRVFCPNVKRFSTVSAHKGSEWHGTYVLPRPTSNIAVLGGTFQRDDERDNCPEDIGAIMERCRKLVPELKDAQVLEVQQWAGLRPLRDQDVRIEAEELKLADEAQREAGRKVFVVHNYGHAGCGWSLCWGCAKDTVELVEGVSAQAAVGSAGKQAGAFEGPEPVIDDCKERSIPREFKRRLAEEGSMPDVASLKI